MTRSAYKNNLTDLGLVTNLSIDQDAAGPGTWILTLDDERAARQVYRLTDGGARGLWYGLTRIIHPLATGQLSSTWSEAPGTTASLFTILAARVRPCRRDGLIEMDAVSAVNGFTARFTAREGRRLWAALERIYGTTGSHSPDQPGARSH